jgi:ribonuclease T1
MNQTTWKQITPYLVAVLIVIYFIYILFGNGGSDPSNDRASPSAGQNSAASEYQQSQATSNSKEISLRDVPREARDTLQLIKQGGPFPYKQDDTVFSNREGLLPAKSSGYYHEYTVVTPGSPDRGARRIVAGKSGEYYYTDDHYRSFKLVRE